MAFAALSIIWGFPYFLIKVAVTDLPPLMIAWSRVTLAALVLVPIAWRRGALAPLSGHTGALVAFAFAEFVIPFAAISIGEQWIGSSVTGILIATVPMWVVLLHEHLGAGGLLAFALILLGSWLATRPASSKLVELPAER
jgi:drug/metabolite transporter (DMT)-like permease